MTLRELRIAAGFTLEGLAKACGTIKGVVYHWERGTTPRGYFIKRIAEALKCRESDVLACFPDAKPKAVKTVTLNKDGRPRKTRAPGENSALKIVTRGDEAYQIVRHGNSYAVEHLRRDVPVGAHRGISLSAAQTIIEKQEKEWNKNAFEGERMYKVLFFSKLLNKVVVKEFATLEEAQKCIEDTGGKLI